VAWTASGVVGSVETPETDRSGFLYCLSGWRLVSSIPSTSSGTA
jgi:hypothetical protein